MATSKWRAKVRAVDTPPRPLTSPLLENAGFRHAFFTREGGVSDKPFDSLNFSIAVGDSAKSVEENIALASKALSVEPSRLYFLSQVHGIEAVRLTGEEDRDEVVRLTGDVTLSSAPDVACAVRIADCVPILIADRETGATAAVHSGWQGTVLGVVPSAVISLRKLIGREGELIAAIGPHIGRCCFEVGEDVAERLMACAPFEKEVVERDRGPRPHIDLRAIVRSQLRALGLEDSAIDDVEGCTQCDEARFFSYRRDKDKSGRHLAAIVTRC